MKILLSIILLAWLGVYAEAQEEAYDTTPPASPEMAEVPSPSAVSPATEKEPSSPFEMMFRGFEQIRLEHEENVMRLESLRKRLQELQHMPSANAYANGAVLFLRDLDDLRNRLATERENQIAYKNEIDRYMSEKQLLRQENSYLGHYLENLRIYGVEQDKMVNFMGAVEHNIRAGLGNLPPPSEFSNRLGISFVLVQVKGRQPFYVSKHAITLDEYLAVKKLMEPERPVANVEAEARDTFIAGMNYEEAQRLALGMSHLSGDLVTLPTVKEVPALNAIGYGEKLEQAVWLQDKWNPPYEEREAMIRFGITMVPIWDPARRLSRRESSEDNSNVFGELPEAHYGALGCVFVVPVAAGKNARVIQAEGYLDQQSSETAAEEEAL